MAAYMHANAWEGERRRLAQVEAAEDPGTIRHLEALGVAAGWRCLEVGGGGGSIAAGLCRRVGPTGAVVATDLGPRFLEALDLPDLAVRRHPAAGGDCSYGRRLYRDLREAGLAAVDAEARARMAAGGSPDAEVARLTLEQLRAPIIAAGLLPPGEVDAMLPLFADPDRGWLSWATVAAWGRRRR